MEGHTQSISKSKSLVTNKVFSACILINFGSSSCIRTCKNAVSDSSCGKPQWLAQPCCHSFGPNDLKGYNVCSNCEEKRSQEAVSTISLKNLNVCRLLGTGKFSKVYLASVKENGHQFALKVLNKKEIEKDKLQHQVLREITIQNNLCHPNIIKLYTQFIDSKRIYLLLEYVPGGELYKLMQKAPMKRFSSKTAAKYIYQVTDAIQYCHSKKVIHRDIKPENLIVDSEGNIKIADFGWSVHSPFSKRKTLCGTLDYIAPEMINKDYYDERVDNWCIGVLCYELLVGVPPFRSKDTNLTFAKISTIDIEYPNFLCRRAKDLISKLVRKYPEDRISLREIKQHDWITSRMLSYS